METIMSKTGADVPSTEVMWIPRAVILITLTKKNFDKEWSHWSAIVVEVTKYFS